MDDLLPVLEALHIAETDALARLPRLERAAAAEPSPANLAAFAAMRAAAVALGESYQAALNADKASRAALLAAAIAEPARLTFRDLPPR